jgi:cyclic pyranopterin phosphate synthase
MEKLSHYDTEGGAHMVDVSAKAATRREAEASAFVVISAAVLAALPQNPKGNPLEVARSELHRCIGNRSQRWD